MKCPQCDTEVEPTYYGDNNEKQIFHCPNCHQTLCPHIGYPLSNFACVECFSPVDECDCMNCSVFCQACNEPIFGMDCSDVVEAWRKHTPTPAFPVEASQ